MPDTKIQWTDATWNPIRGCSLVSEGCRKCYAMKQAHRFSGPGGAYEGLTELGPDGPRWTGKIRTVPEMLDAPLRWRKPQRVFVNSMSDLFHEDVPREFIYSVFSTMALVSRHTYQILTKRPQRMMEFLTEAVKSGAAVLPNVWLGVSVEDQKTADERIPLLLQTPAAVRFVSYEPALGPVDFMKPGAAFVVPPPECTCYEFLGGHQAGCPMYGMSRESVKNWEQRHCDALDWVIIGGESGPGARPFNIQWACDVIAQCRAAGVACFMKQLGRNPYQAPSGITPSTSGPDAIKCRIYELDIDKSKGGDPAEWPEDLRVREFPK